jgi:PAS domain S-box-containing protein
MQRTSYPVPAQESERQEALRRYKVLDTPPEESFDRLTRLAAQLFGVPVALISLIDADRQWHKSCYGFDARELSREVSFCAHNLVEDDVMVVQDALADARFAHNPLVTADPNVRFYAGAPLITPGGYTLGSLCVLDVTPRTFAAAQQAQLRDLAAMVMDELDLRREVAERKRAERALQESEEKYRTVVESVRDVVFRTDAEGRLTFLNPAWTEVTGHRIEAALGQRLSAFVHQTSGDPEGTGVERLRAGDNDFGRYEVQFKTSGAAPRWMEVFARPMCDENGDVVGTSGTLHDVTKWREAEAQMRKALDKERELGRLKSRFVSMASHELRTPLATIQSSAELASLFMQRGAHEKTDKHLRRIQNNVERMATLLEDVLIFGRVESGQLPFEPIEMDMAGLATELVDDIKQGIGAGHVLQTSGVDQEVALVADPQLLRLILTNLLSNAVKYSPEGSTVRLCVQPTDDVVHITVSDEGIGIPSEDIDRLFEPFHRAENVGATRGTGLGLAILNEAVGVHNGDVKVESAKGKGSTFHVTLPRAHPVADAASRR